ncbi:MAG: 5'-nucleotidase C-terminal domain-containing protein [Saprospiraceae bacterium]|jgi:sulfur-oxidizing protein SoxB|nr:5'-nucleotidase C-terminal domain-containing protein [Saprospiraceae bacterium]
MKKTETKKGASRRDFLKTGSLLGLGATLAPLSTAAALTKPAEIPLAGEEHAADAPPPPRSGTITLLQTTDVHCQIHPHDELFWENNGMVFRKTAGYAQLATLFDKVRKSNPDTFIVDTGDMFQGSELSVKTTGKAFVPILNALGYDLYLPGNWEVIYYKQAMQKLLGGLDAPKVCANMYHDLGDGKRGELVFPPYATWSRLGVKIGFVGLTDHLVPLRQSPNYSKGIIYTKPEESLAPWVQVLREQEQCDFVIVLAHLGLSQQIHLANLPVCEGVDYIFGGDTHERVREPIVCKFAKVVEPGAFGSFVGRLDLEIKDGKIVGERYELMEVDAKKYKPQKSVQQLIDTLEAPFVASINKVHGYSTVPLYRYFVVENTIDTLILDALDWRVNTDIVLSNGFRFCPPRNTGADGLAPITEGFIYDMLPVDSRIRTGTVTGQQILDWLEKELNNVFAKDASKRFGGWVVKFKGMEVEFNAFGEAGKRVQKVMVGNQPLDPARSYTIAACERDGDPETMLCRIPNVKNTVNTEFTLHQTMRDYLAANSPVTPRPRGYAKVLDAPQTLLTQVTGVEYAFR